MGNDVVEREAVEVVTDAERRARVLEAAALEIEVRGWAQHTACRTTGELCGGGAILAAVGSTPTKTWFDDCDMASLAQVWGWTKIDEPDVRDGNAVQIAPFNDRVAESASDVTFLLRWRAEEIRDGR